MANRKTQTKRRFEIIEQLAVAGRRYREVDLPAAQGALLAAQKAAFWPSPNPFPTTAMGDASAALAAITLAYESLRRTAGSELETIEVVLRIETAFECDRAVSDLIDEADNSRKKYESVVLDRRQHPLTGAQQCKIWSNSASVLARCDAIFAALQRVEELRFVENSAEIKTEFRALWAGLPPIERAPEVKRNVS